MRIVLLVSAILLLCASSYGQIVNNSGTSSEDSVVAYVRCLDSLGNVSFCDSFFVYVFKSGTNAAVFSDSGTTGMTGLDTLPFRASATPDKVLYYFHRAVADIDGSGNIGQYQLVVVAQKTGGTGWYTPNSMSFQIVNAELSDALDTVGIAYRQAKVATDTLALYDTRWDSTLAVFADANTLLKNRLLRIRDSVDVILDTLQNHDNWVATQANQTKIIDTVNGVIDTLQATDTRWDSTLANFADANTLMKNRFLRIRDSVDAILDTLQNTDNWIASAANLTKVIDTVNGIIDTLQVTDTRWDSTLAVFADANTLLKNRLLRIRDTVDATLDTLQVTDTRWDSTLAVFADANTLVKNRLLRIRDSVDATLDTLQNQDNWVSSAANLTKAIDTVNAVLDTLQNSSSTLRASGTGATAADVKAALFADTSKKIGFKGGAGDSVKVVGNVTTTVDTAALARSVWDNDVVPRASRTIDEVDTVVLACINGDTVASAGDFLKTAADYRREIKNIFGVSIDNSTWATDTTLNQLLRQAVVKVNPIMRGVKFKDTVITSWQRSDYNLDSMIGVIAVSWQHEDTVQSITYLPLEGWGALAHKSTYGQDDPYLARPSVYDVTDNQIMFYPPPTEVDTIEVVGFRKVYGIVTTSDFSAIPQAYRIPVLYYMAYLVAQSKQNPNTDRLLNEYNRAVSDILVALNRRVNAQTDSK